MAFGRVIGGLWTVLGIKDETKKPVDNARKNLDNFSGSARKAGGSLLGVSRGAMTTVRALHNIANALDVSSLAASKTFQLDKQFQNLAVQAGTGQEAVVQMEDAMLGLANRTGLSTDETSKLVAALAATGQSVTDLDPKLKNTSDQFAAISNGAAKNTEMLSELVGRFGVSASAAVEFASQSRNLGLSIGDLGDKAAQWQKQFKMPGMLAQLPQVVGYAEKSITQFGRAVAGDSKQIIESTLKMGAIYAKTFGVDMASATRAVQDNQQHFLRTIANNRKVFLGLSSDFDQLTMSLFEAGMQYEDIDALIKQGKDDPVKYARSLKQIEEQLAATYGPDSAYVQRFHQQMVDNSSEAVKKLLEEKGALEAAEKAQKDAAKYQASAAGKAEATFGSMTDALRDVGGTAMETFRNLLQLGKQILGMTFAKDIGDTFKGLASKLRNFNIALKETANRFAKSEEYKRIKPVLQSVGKVLIMVGGAASLVAGSIATLYKPVQIITSLFGRIPVLGKGTGFFFNTIFGFAKKLLTPLAAIKGVGTALNDIGETLRNPKLTSSERTMAVLRGAFVGMADFIDTLFLGLPGKILGIFFPRFKGGLAKGTRALFNSWQRDLKKSGVSSFQVMFKAVERWVTDKLVQFRAYVFENLNKWKQSAKQVGANIGRALGYLTTVAVDIITKVFTVKWWQQKWTQVVNYFTKGGGVQMVDAFSDIFYSILDVAGEFSDAMVDEFMHAFGSSSDDVRAFWEDTKEAFRWGWRQVEKATQSFVDWISVTWDKVGLYFTEVGASIKYVFLSAWDEVKKGGAALELFIVESVIQPIVKKIADLKLELAKARDSWDPTFSKEDMKKAQQQHDALIAGVEGYASASRDAAKLIGTDTEKTLKADNEIIKQKRRSIAEYERLSKKESEEDDLVYQKRENDRTAEIIHEREARKKARVEKEKARKEEQDKFEAAQKRLEAVKEPAAQQVENIIKELEKQKAAAEQKGNTKLVEKIDRRLDKENEALGRIQDASDPKAVVNLLNAARKIAGLKKDLAPKKDVKPFDPGKAAEGAGNGPAAPSTTTVVTPGATKVAGAVDVNVKLVDNLGKTISETMARASVAAAGMMGGM